MAAHYKTPGVYTQEVSRFPPSIAAVETAVPAFIGYTEKAEHNAPGDLKLVPTRIASLSEYEVYFGHAQQETAIKVTITTSPGDGTASANATLDETAGSSHILYYALQMFFENGGGPCYIVSVGAYKAVAADLSAQELRDGLDALQTNDEPTLLLIPEAQNMSDSVQFGALQAAALKQCFDLQDRFVIMDIHGGTHSLSDPSTDMGVAVSAFRTQGLTETDVEHLKYGAAYAPNLKTTVAFSFDPASTEVIINGAAAVTLDKVDAQTNALALGAIRGLLMNLPPSAAVAGLYAKVDSTRGVWKAPANEKLANVVGPTIAMNTAEQDGMNVDAAEGKSVNAIRSFSGKGTLVWGARTLAGNSNEWRYVSVRRFFIFVTESTRRAAAQFIFAPNDANTWVRVRAMIENFLTTQWRVGALQGAKPEQAFYVAVGLGKTMTALDIQEGRMIVELGLAAARPAEFIVVRFSQQMAQS